MSFKGIRSDTTDPAHDQLLTNVLVLLQILSVHYGSEGNLAILGSYPWCRGCVVNPKNLSIP